MKKFKKLLAVGVALLATVVLAACGNAAADEDTVTIGYAINNLNDTFQNFILEAAQAQAAEYGFDIRVENAREDLITQQDQVNTLIQNGVDALVVVPVDTSAMDPITQAAQNAGIPLVYVNRNPFAGREDEMPENVFFVGSEEIAAGQMQMEFIGEKLGGTGGVAVAMGILGNEGALRRTEGVTTVAADQFPGMNILAQETAEWQRDQALTLAENWISAFGNDLQAILANNDEMALGALQAARNNNRTDILIMGVDAIPDAVDAVASGDLAGTIFQDGAGQGGGAISIIHGVVTGNAPSDSILWIPFQLVTPENAEDFR